MSRRWIRVPPEKGDTLAAAIVSGAIATGVALVTFYLVRTLLARESIEPELGRAAIPPRARREKDGPGDQGA